MRVLFALTGGKKSTNQLGAEGTEMPEETAGGHAIQTTRNRHA